MVISYLNRYGVRQNGLDLSSPCNICGLTFLNSMDSGCHYLIIVVLGCLRIFSVLDSIIIYVLLFQEFFTTFGFWDNIPILMYLCSATFCGVLWQLFSRMDAAMVADPLGHFQVYIDALQLEEANPMKVVPPAAPIFKFQIRRGFIPYQVHPRLCQTYFWT